MVHSYILIIESIVRCYTLVNRKNPKKESWINPRRGVTASKSRVTGSRFLLRDLHRTDY